MKFDTDDLKASLKNYQQKASDQFKDFAENDWPDIKDHVTEKGQQAGDYLKKMVEKFIKILLKLLKKALEILISG